MKKPKFIFLLVFLVILSACRHKDTVYTSLQMLEGGKTFAVPTGTAADQMVLNRFPDAKVIYYNTILDCALAVQIGKADATVYDKPVLKNIAGKNENLQVLDELVLPDNYGFAVAMENVALKNAIDQTLQELKQSGIYDDMMKRWFPAHGSPEPMPAFAPLDTDEVLYFGTAAVTEPMAFVDGNNQVVGFDVEFAQRIARNLNKKLEVVNMEFGAMLPALIARKVDMIGAGLSITEERAKSVLFSEPYYESGLVAMVRSITTDTGDILAPAEAEEGQTWQVIGVLMGSMQEHYAMKHYPASKILAFNTVPDLLMAIQQGKVDVSFMDAQLTAKSLKTTKGLVIENPCLFSIETGVGFRKDSKTLRIQFNEFLAEMQANGSYDQWVKKWVEDESDDIKAITMLTSGEVLKIGTASDLGMPFIGKSEGRMQGFDAEMGYQFGNWLGRRVEWQDMPFGSLLPSLKAGKIDLIISTLVITEERKLEIDFSDPYYKGSVSTIVKDKEYGAKRNGKMAVLDDIAGKRVGIFSGTVFHGFLERTFPSASIHIFESSSDMIMALKTGKIDAVMLDKLIAQLVMKSNPEVGLLTDEVYETPLGVGFNKNNPNLLAEFNEYLLEIREDGTFQSMVERWFHGDPEIAVMPEFPVNHQGQKLVAGVSVADFPYVAMKNGNYVGFDIEMLQHFAQRRNYKLEFVSLEFSSLVAALAAGKVDLIADGISISEERAAQINFSDAYTHFQTAIIALKKNLGNFEETDYVAKEGFFAKLNRSFQNNILKEKRYLLILRGLYVTILISIFAAILGTILGALVCLMRMSKNRISLAVASYYIALVRGTPVLVLLMIIYYVVFASVNINPVLVAILAFALNFAAYVSEMFRTGIQGIDSGQKEAGIAGGFTQFQTFYHIILPQALRQVLPVYKGEFISLVKMTSVVGYIAVEDLTKASDIIRSRTFDAFFPLIMAAILYILISYALTRVLTRIEISVDPGKRSIRFRKEVAK